MKLSAPVFDMALKRLPLGKHVTALPPRASPVEDRYFVHLVGSAAQLDAEAAAAWRCPGSRAALFIASVAASRRSQTR